MWTQQPIYCTFVPYCQPETSAAGICAQGQVAAAPAQAGHPSYAQTISALNACTLIDMCGLRAGVTQQAVGTAGPVQPQGTLGIVNCTVTPFCGNQAAQFQQPVPQQGYPNAGCAPQQAAAIAAAPAQAAQTIIPPYTQGWQGCTMYPLCNTGYTCATYGSGSCQVAQVQQPVPQQAHPAHGWVQQQAAATAQGGVQPQATLGPLQCNITVFTLCTPVCGQ